MRCPSCGSSLREKPMKSVDIDICPQCEGIWFDHKELSWVVTELKVQGKIKQYKLKEKEKIISPFRIRQRKRSCPRCYEIMKTINYAVDSNILVDKCLNCKGIWVDGNLIDSLLSYIRGNDTLDSLGKAIVQTYKEQKDIEIEIFSSFLEIFSIFTFFIPVGEEKCSTPFDTSSESMKSFMSTDYISPVTTILILSNIGLFILSPSLLKTFAFSRASLQSSIFSPFFNIFIHTSLWHLVSDVFFL